MWGLALLDPLSICCLGGDPAGAPICMLRVGGLPCWAPPNVQAMGEWPPQHYQTFYFTLRGNLRYKLGTVPWGLLK